MPLLITLPCCALAPLSAGGLARVGLEAALLALSAAAALAPLLLLLLLPASAPIQAQAVTMLACAVGTGMAWHGMAWHGMAWPGSGKGVTPPPPSSPSVPYLLLVKFAYFSFLAWHNAQPVHAYPSSQARDSILLPLVAAVATAGGHLSDPHPGTISQTHTSGEWEYPEGNHPQTHTQAQTHARAYSHSNPELRKTGHSNSHRDDSRRRRRRGLPVALWCCVAATVPG
jgi:hypothetical protein